MDPRPVDVRRDGERLRDLHLKAFPSAVQFVMDASDGPADDDLVFGVDGPDGQMVAYLYGEIDGDRVHIWELAVHPDFRRRGVGRTLLRHLATLCGPMGILLITVTPMGALGPEAEARLTAYFERCGFRTVDPLDAMEAAPAEVLSALGPLV
jgi:ribosomal protein S18 acetylase RimI-like enzyme